MNLTKDQIGRFERDGHRGRFAHRNGDCVLDRHGKFVSAGLKSSGE